LTPTSIHNRFKTSINALVWVPPTLAAPQARGGQKLENELNFHPLESDASSHTAGGYTRKRIKVAFCLIYLLPPPFCPRNARPHILSVAILIGLTAGHVFFLVPEHTTTSIVGLNDSLRWQSRRKEARPMENFCSNADLYTGFLVRGPATRQTRSMYLEARYRDNSARI
jgi:hypothetical protein